MEDLVTITAELPPFSWQSLRGRPHREEQWPHAPVKVTRIGHGHSSLCVVSDPLNVGLNHVGLLIGGFFQ